jgi:hypothetical protein
LIQTMSLRSSRTMTKGIEQIETDSWNSEQVHGGNVRACPHEAAN